MTANGYPKTELDPCLDSCPPHEMLEQFVQLALSPECNQVVRQHVERCATCQVELDKFTGSPQFAPPESLPSSVAFDSTVDRLVERLCGDTSKQTVDTHTLPLPIRLNKSSSESLGALSHFHIRRELASGATATVFEAVDTKSNQLVAIKFIRGGDENSLRRVQREARAISQIKHECVVSVQSVEFAEDGRMYLVMPLVPGRPLSEIIRDQIQLPPEHVAKIIHQIADGLVEVHRQGVLHRDIKPSNILVDSDGAARITDFGLAEFVHEESSLTATGAVVGTPSYMSPEQAAGKRELDHRSDIYSLGVTLYECLTLTRAFRGSTADVIRQILNDEPLLPRTIDPRIPRDLELICLKAMAKEPRRRYVGAVEFRDDLARWLDGKPILARPMGLVERTCLWSVRNPLVATMSAALMLSIIAGVVGVWWNWQLALHQRDEARENLRQAMRAVDQFYTKISVPAGSLDQPGLQPLRRQLLQDAVKAYEEFLGKWPDDPLLREDAANATRNLAAMVDEVGNTDEIIAAWSRAVDATQILAAEETSDSKWRDRLHSALFHRATAFTNSGRFPEAIETFMKVRSIAADLAVEYPKRFEYRRLMAAAEASLANCEMIQDHSSNARTHYLAAVEVFRQLVKDEPENPDLRGKLAVTLTNLGLVTPSDQRPPLYQEARELLLGSAPTPLPPMHARRIAKIDYSEGITFKELGRIDEALASFRSGIEKMQPHVEANPSVGDYRWMVGELIFELAQLLGPTDEGLAQMKLAKEHREILYRTDPNSVEYKQDIYETVASLVAFQDRMNMGDEARDLIAAIADLPNASDVYENVAMHLAEANPPVELLGELTKKVVPQDATKPQSTGQ